MRHHASAVYAVVRPSVGLCLSQAGVVSYYYFASAAVAIDSSHMTASSSAYWSRFSLLSNFVNRHVLTMWFMVCRSLQSQKGDWARPHLCKLAWHGPWPVRKWFIRDHVWRGRSKPGCRILGLVTIVWLSTEADGQSSLHWVIVSQYNMTGVIYMKGSDLKWHQATLGKGIMLRNHCTNRAGFSHIGFLPPIPQCVKEICISPKITVHVLPSGTVPNSGFRKFSHGKSIALSKKLVVVVNSQVCWVPGL